MDSQGPTDGEPLGEGEKPPEKPPEAAAPRRRGRPPKAPLEPPSPSEEPPAPHEGNGKIVLTSKDPLATAESFIHHAHERDGNRLLHYHREKFYRWDGASFVLQSDNDIKKQVVYFLRSGGVTPNISRETNAVNMLRRAAGLSDFIEPGGWLGETPEGYPAAEELIPMKTGLFHPATRKVYPPTPQLFNLNALPFDFTDEGRKDPVEWYRFLASVWEDDVQSVECLQEIMGYLLTTDNRFHKMFLIQGPPRSGKGTIARILTALLGKQNVCGPTLPDFASNFGLSGLLGKTVAIVGDAKSSGYNDSMQAQVVSRLKSITGGDEIQVDRKFYDPITITLKTRILMMANELPKLFDDSGAFAGRFVLLRMKKSFAKAPDVTLQDRLMPELPQILHWALLGRERLYSRRDPKGNLKGFIVPESARILVREMQEESAPIKAFLREKCKVGDALSIPSSRLYAIWKRWCEDRGKKEGSLDWLARALRAAVPEVESKRARGKDVNGPKMVTMYLGIGERGEEDEESED